MKIFSSCLMIAAILSISFLHSCKNTKQDKKEGVANVKESAISPWQAADNIIKAIQIPQFPDRTFNVLDYGAKADGKTDNSKAFARAITACSEAGGGKVLVPSGEYLTGPIHLKSNVNFHLDDGTEIFFTTDKSAYLPVVHTSFEGMELMNYSPLIYAYKQENIAVTGNGTFNGQASNQNWWPWKGKEIYGYDEGEPKQQDEHNLDRLRKMVEDGVPVSQRIFGEGHQFRPTFFEPFDCENVLIKGVTFINAPFWVMHPIKSTHVTIDGVKVISHGPNNDGCNPEYSKYVHITNCMFDTGDDCIAIKSGRNDDGRRVNVPSENIVIENCVMKDGHGGVVIGSEISAGVRNIYVRNCRMNSPNLDRAIRIKTNTKRGGFVKNLYVKNIEVGQVKEAVLKINTHYAIYGDQEGEYIPVIEGIHLENVTVKNGGEYGVYIRGRETAPVSDVTFEDVTINSVETPLFLEHVEPIKYENTTINGMPMEELLSEG